MQGRRVAVVVGAALAAGAFATVVAAAPQKHRAGRPAAAAPEPSVGPITGPIADYWVSASTASGFGAQFMGGGRPSMGALMGMAMGRGGGPQKSLTLDLGSTQSPSGAPQAAHAPPPGLGVGPSLPLLTPRPPKPGAPEARETDPGDPETYHRPKGRLLFYWGCGDHVGPGQPVVFDFSTIGTGAPLPDLGGAITVHTERPPSYGRVTTYGRWPNEQTRVKVPATGSLVGPHSVRGDYSPDIGFEVTPDLDFMPSFDVQNTGPTPGGGKRLAWTPLQQANGYYLQLIGAQGQGGGRGREEGADMVFWSSSAVKPGLFGGGLADYLPPAEVSRLVAQRAVLPPQASECVVPAEVAQAAPMGIVLSIAYGTGAHLHRPAPAPQRSVGHTLAHEGARQVDQHHAARRARRHARRGRTTATAHRRRHRQEDPRRVQALLMRRALPLLILLPLAACAHGGGEPQASLPMPEPPNARARLYAECLGDSARAGTYERFGRYLRLTCSGAPAEALFTTMETFSRARGHITVADGVETRAFSGLAWDDRCWKGAAGVSCRITVPVGAFLDPAKDVPAPDPKASKP